MMVYGVRPAGYIPTVVAGTTFHRALSPFFAWFAVNLGTMEVLAYRCLPATGGVTEKMDKVTDRLQQTFT